MKVSGVVTRTSDVKPCITCACYACDVCGAEMVDTIPGPLFMPRVECESEACRTNMIKGKISLQVRGSKFTSYQEIRIQECSDQVPIGHVPRTMTIVAKGHVTRQCGPGDLIKVSGVFEPTPLDGKNRAQRIGTLLNVHIAAFKIERTKKSFSEKLSEEAKEKIQMERKPGIYDRVIYNGKNLAGKLYCT